MTTLTNADYSEFAEAVPDVAMGHLAKLGEDYGQDIVDELRELANEFVAVGAAYRVHTVEAAITKVKGILYPRHYCEIEEVLCQIEGEAGDIPPLLKVIRKWRMRLDNKVKEAAQAWIRENGRQALHA